MMGPMDVREEIAYDASPDAVFEMLCDQEFREKVCRGVGSVRYEVTISSAADGATVRNHRVMKADLPDFARKVVGDTIEMVQTEEWGPRESDGSRRGTFHVEIPGKPGSIRGTVSIAAERAGTREVVDGTVKVSIPLVGRKLEAEVVRGLKAALEVEGRIGAGWLDGRR
jgi:Protein of unknown function (DUF2505)